MYIAKVLTISTNPAPPKTPLRDGLGAPTAGIQLVCNGSKVTVSLHCINHVRRLLRSLQAQVAYTQFPFLPSVQFALN